MISYRSIVRLVWPIALGMVNSAVMQFVDRAYLAWDSMVSLEAVLPAGVLAWIFMSFFQSLVGYSSVFVAQCHGAGLRGDCRFVYRASLLLVLGSELLILLLIPFGDRILAHTASSPALCAMERSYYDILMLGGVCVFGQMAAASYFTGRGETRIVFWVNLAGNLLNVALDPLLIFGWGPFPRLGIAGAAWATVGSMALQWLLLACAAERSLRCEAAASSATVRRYLWQILRFGIPAGAYSVLNMLSFTVFVFVTGSVGEFELAVSNACFTVNYLLYAPVEGFSIGAQTLVGQARGAGDDGKTVIALRRTLVLALALVAVAGLLVIAFGGPLLSLFAASAAGRSPEFHSLGFKLLLIMCAWLLFDAADVVLSGALKGAGDTKFVMWWMSICSFGVWLPLVFAVRAFHNTMPALWATTVVYTVVICIGSWIRWRRGRWRTIDVMG